MRALLAIIAGVLMVPVLLVVAIALGPAALGIVFIAGIALVVIWAFGFTLRHLRSTRPSALH